MEKHIYIMFSHTNTKMGKIIQFFSNYTYNHVSISVDSSLQPLYSFARYHYNAALVGGFVEESPLRYIWDGRDTTIRIYDLVISEEQFKKFEIIISLYRKKSTQYIYDHFYFFRKDTCRSKYQHTCLSFVVDILKDLQIQHLFHPQGKYRPSRRKILCIWFHNPPKLYPLPSIHSCLGSHALHNHLQRCTMYMGNRHTRESPAPLRCP